jgi:hypothetical protein
MFLQIFEGEVRDADAFERQMQVWKSDVKPGAVGFLGSTSGMTDDGRFIAVARFESEDAARRNSERPEQDAWWRATEPALGNVAFTDCTEVDTFLNGGSDDAGFVQIMKGRATDPAKLREMGNQMEAEMTKARPDVLGGVIGWHGDREFTQVIYFTNESEARAGEATMGEGPEPGPDDWSAMMDGEITFIDLNDPQFD